jgi:hypothetical protein
MDKQIFFSPAAGEKTVAQTGKTSVDRYRHFG